LFFYALIGVALHSQGDFNKAIVLYEEAYRLDGGGVNNNDILPALATALHNSNRIDEAAKLYSIAIAKNPENVILLCNYAKFLCSNVDFLNANLHEREETVLIAHNVLQIVENLVSSKSNTYNNVYITEANKVCKYSASLIHV
jgi:tetratricopeptide (TPR) repeat protein